MAGQVVVQEMEVWEDCMKVEVVGVGGRLQALGMGWIGHFYGSSKDLTKFEILSFPLRFLSQSI